MSALRRVLASSARFSTVLMSRSYVHAIRAQSMVQASVKMASSNNLILNNRLYSTDQSSKKNEVHKQIDAAIKKSPVVVFMKGTSEQPMCGFSKAVCDILNMHGVKFDSHNVLADEGLRAGIKEFTNWPTIPQVFFNGEFIGGCDILLEMHRSGEIIDELKKIGITSKLEEEEDKPSK